MSTLRFAFFIWAAVLVGAANAQMCEPPTPGKIVAFESGRLFEGVGSSDMPISSSNEKAKALVRQGFAMIHCFWFDEAIRSMRDAVKEDPSCAIAWCGLYLAIVQPWSYGNDFEKEATYAIQRAVANVSSASEAEQRLIVACRMKSLNRDARGSDFEKEMRKLIADFPKLKEPRLLLAGILCQLCMHTAYTPEGDVRGDLMKVQELIDPILKSEPLNAGAMHYHIHAMEPFSPQKAIKSAENIGKIAFRSSHMVHMAGHIFNRVGRYEEGHKAFARAREIEEADGKALGVTPFEANWNYGHNRAFMAMNLAEMGKVDEALLAVDKMNSMRTEIFWRAGDWAKAIEEGRTSYGRVSPTRRQVFFEGMQAAKERNYIVARMKADDLETRFRDLAKDRDKSKFTTEMRMLCTMANELSGAVLCLEGKVEEGIAKFEAAMDAFDTIEYDEPVTYGQLPHETYGYAMIRAERFEAAKKAFRRGLKARPMNAWSQKGLVETEAAEVAARSRKGLP